MERYKIYQRVGVAGKWSLLNVYETATRAFLAATNELQSMVGNRLPGELKVTHETQAVLETVAVLKAWP